jgi:apolipoprotein N-acyltransferase
MKGWELMPVGESLNAESVFGYVFLIIFVVSVAGSIIYMFKLRRICPLFFGSATCLLLIFAGIGFFGIMRHGTENIALQNAILLAVIPPCLIWIGVIVKQSEDDGGIR